MSEKKIIKFELEDISEKSGYASFTRVDIHKGGKVIDVSYAGGKTYLHVICNPLSKKKARWFATFEENMPMEDYDKKTCEYIGRVGTMLVPELYVFEVHD